MTRLYLPATLAVLADLEATGRIAVPDGAVAAADDSEDAEYDALVTAADASAALVAGLPAGARRRVVVVAEVPATPDVPGTPALTGTPRDIPLADIPLSDIPLSDVPLSDVVAVHADATDDADPDDDLGWYATQEIPALIR